MACILKLPGESKGIVTFTSEEQRSGVQNLDSFDKLKSNWIVGLHHNWQIEPHNFSFDFSMGRKEGISPSNAPVIDIDASCFSTPEFFPSDTHEKFWDIIHIARAVEFRSIDLFMDIIRKVYDTGFKPRALLITAIPDDPQEVRPSNVVQHYEDLFSTEERKRFNLIDITYNYPFPWDYETLGFYLRSSKVFLNAQRTHLPCRVSTMAVSCGLPFVTYPWSIPLVPREIEKEPAQYIGSSQEELCSKLISAIRSYDANTSSNEYIIKSVNHFKYENVMTRLKQAFRDFMESRGETFVDERFNLLHLDYRIARHHGMSIGSNKVDMKLDRLIDILVNNYDDINMDADDVEVNLCTS